ncbi:glycoside hydrolase family 127 protein [Microbacterium sp. NEAU-LLC]|uniref:Glycoside hydrolase family 127 protein n=1 Tax=Microbacterium helvum TaxID=2773713 RepID=A0ABR8NIE0_9MICO|nr:beta-L-arabinofuranosidase domain-containing protein [Microbacterium helvum]MBD3940464.1 glycoside hydrolase family 127 protein [Microbacterium helvum]
MTHHRSRRWAPAAVVSAIALILAAGTTPAHAADELTVGPPVLELTFENTVTDTGPSAHPVQLMKPGGAAPTATYVPGVAPGSSAIALSSSYLDLGTSTDLLPTSLSLSFWLKPAAPMSGEEIITWNKKAFNSDGFYVSSESSSSPLVISIGPASGQPYKVRVQQSDRNAFFPAGAWTHIVVTYDGPSKNVVFYRNGVRVPSTVASAIAGDATGIIAPDADVPKTIGYNGPNYNGAFLKAALDQYRLYAGVTTVADVAALYEEGGGVIDKAAIAAQDAAALVVPSSTLVDLSLPTTGSSGSAISWASSDPAVIEDDGTVHLPDAGAEDAVVTLTASVRYAGGPASTRTFEVTVQAPTESLQDSGLDVLLSDDYLKNGMEKEQEYLLSLSYDTFLYWFSRTAGLTPRTASGYGGWENGNASANFRGHAFGHYMSALAMSYAASDDTATKAALATQLTNAVSGLEEVQNSYAGSAQQGYIAPFRPTAFNQVEGRGASDDPVIVPYYNMHKVLAGLLDIKRYAPAALGDRALAVAEGWGEYLYGRMSTLADKSQMLRTEYGGTNEALYELFRLTGNPHIKTAAEAFDETSLFRSLAAGQDVLNGKHANTMIPKVIGALKRYTVFTQNPEYLAMLTPAEKQDLGMYLTAAQNFWQIVAEHHTYVTGANSQAEHFHGADELYRYAAEMGETGNPQTAETCNVYNMLKLSRELFKLTQDVRYADFYETAYINDILSSQNPDTGMTTYFQAMAPGYNKLYSMPFTDFWCCTGSGMENFSKLGDSIYFTGRSSVWVNMFFSSAFSYAGANMRVTQTADLPTSDTVTFEIGAADGGAVAEDAELRLRVPDWIDGEPTVAVNAEAVQPTIDEGYVVLRGLDAGDVVTYRMPMKLVAIAAPDNPDFVAFRYGPTVLSAGAGTKDLGAYTPVGIGVRVPKLDPDALSSLVVAQGTSATWLASLSENLVRIEDSADGEVQFEVRGTSNADGTRFTPHYLRSQERYAMYVTIESPDSQAAQQRILDSKLAQRTTELYIDSLTNFDNNNFEAEKNKKASANSTVGTFNGRQYRDANSGGWFSWDLEVDPAAEKNLLAVTYYSGDSGRSFDVYLDDVKLKTQTITNSAGTNVFYDVVDEISRTYIDGPGVRHKVDALGNLVLDAEGNPIPVVTVRFQSTGGFAGGVFGIATTRPLVYDSNPALKALTFDVGTLDTPFAPATTSYVLSVPAGVTEVDFDADPQFESGLVKVGDILIDDTQPRRVAVTPGSPTALTITSFAQDHTTSTSYTVLIQEQHTAPLKVTASVTTRCVAGKVTLVVQVRNAEQSAVALDVQTPYGAKHVEALGGGKSASYSFSTRLAQLEPGEVSVDAAAAVDGQPVSTRVEASYGSASCN